MEKVFAASHCSLWVWPGKNSSDSVGRSLCLTRLLWTLLAVGLGTTHAGSSIDATPSEKVLQTQFTPSPILPINVDTSAYHTLTVPHLADSVISQYVLPETILTDSVNVTSVTVQLQASAYGQFSTTPPLLLTNLVQKSVYDETVQSSSGPVFESSFQSAVSQALSQGSLGAGVTASANTVVLDTTDYLDSVAASVRWNPSNEWADFSPTPSVLPPPETTSPETPPPETSPPETTSPGSSVTSGTAETTEVISTISSTVSENTNFTAELTPGSTTVPTARSSDSNGATVTGSQSHFVLATSQSFLLASSTADSDMVETNATVHPAFTEFVTSISTSGDATAQSFTTSDPDLAVTSPSAVTGNDSCSHNSGGCVEYRGDVADEDVQMKIIVGVVCGVVAIIIIMVVVVGCVRRRRGKMSSGSKIDLSSYWDDSVTLSYINGHVDPPKDSADEMISLDNDSFLNSLDSVSYSNTWTSDNSKHTIF